VDFWGFLPYIEGMTKEITFPGIGDYMAPYFPHFRRSEGRELARCYVVGLMMEGERKSVEPMSEKVNASERSMQRLLTEVKWDEGEVIQEYRRGMLAETSDPQGVLVVDDSAFPKKGAESVCVARQYCGATGKIDNCQVGVSLTYVGRDVAWPYAMDLFVPESWDDMGDLKCALRRRKTRMPETARHKPKWRMALEQIDLATASGVPHRAVVADSWYGKIPEFRQGLVDREKSYVVGVYSDTEVFLEAPVIEIAPPKSPKGGRPRKRPKFLGVNPEPVRVSQLGEKIEEEAWEHLELRPNSRGKPLVVEAVSLRVWPATGYKKGDVHEEVWLIIERRPKENGDFELRYFLSNLPQEHPTIEMVRLFHERYWIEQGYQQLKEELGLDHHEGRSWTGWHRHILLVFIAYGYLTHLRLLQKKQKSLESRKAWLAARKKLGREFFG
jgi:SRSO17 transposase